MNSIIKNAAALGINYSASSMTCIADDRKPGNALIDNDVAYFESKDSPSHQWWQVSFSKIVEINSYTIRSASSWGYRPLGWEAMASMDGVHWDIVSIVSKDAGGNTEKFPTYYKVNCKYFRIVHKENFNKNDYLEFTFFDCFGQLGKNVSRRILCFQNTIYHTKQLSFSTILYLFVTSY